MRMFGRGGREFAISKPEEVEKVPEKPFFLNWLIEGEVVEVYRNSEYEGSESEFMDAATLALKALKEKGYTLKSFTALSTVSDGESDTLLVLVEKKSD